MRHLQVPSGAGHVAWDSECVCVCTCVSVPCAHVHFGTTFTHVHACVHVCVRTCVHAYGCVDVCACVSWVEMPLFRGSDQALLQNAVLRVAAPRVFTGVTYGLWVLLKPRPCF